MTPFEHEQRWRDQQARWNREEQTADRRGNPPPPLAWQLAWRDGIAPQLSTAGLKALERALADDDPRLIQGCTVAPLAAVCGPWAPAQGCCPIGFSFWQGDGVATVGDVAASVNHVIADCTRISNVSAVWFLNFVDSLDRVTMRHALLDEVRFVLRERRCMPTTQAQEP